MDSSEHIPILKFRTTQRLQSAHYFYSIQFHRSQKNNIQHLETISSILFTPIVIQFPFSSIFDNFLLKIFYVHKVYYKFPLSLFSQERHIVIKILWLSIQLKIAVNIAMIHKIFLAENNLTCSFYFLVPLRVCVCVYIKQIVVPFVIENQKKLNYLSDSTKFLSTGYPTNDQSWCSIFRAQNALSVPLLWWLKVRQQYQHKKGTANSKKNLVVQTEFRR